VHYLLLFGYLQRVQHEFNFAHSSHVHVQLERFNHVALPHSFPFALTSPAGDKLKPPAFQLQGMFDPTILHAYLLKLELPAQTHQPPDVEAESDDSGKKKKARKLVRASMKAPKYPPSESPKPMT
jgi:hypothetical protein